MKIISLTDLHLGDQHTAQRFHNHFSIEIKNIVFRELPRIKKIITRKENIVRQTTSSVEHQSQKNEFSDVINMR